jgi:Flp pilus assembly protein TadG
MAFRLDRIAAFGRNTAGATTVEFALAAPILFLLMFAIIEFGRAWWTKNALQYAVERAVRYAVICNGACPSDGAVQTYAVNQVYDQSVATNTFSVTHPAGATCVNYSFSYTPWFVGDMSVVEGSMTLTGTSCRAHS